MAVDVYELVTGMIIDELEKGVVPWQKPWIGMGGAVSHSTGKPYSLVNQLMVGEPGEYATFKQVSDAKGKVKKGAKSKPIIYYKPIVLDAKNMDGTVQFDDDGNPVKKTIPYIQYFRVFNLKDCEGIEPKWLNDNVDRVIPSIEAGEAALMDYINTSGVGLNVNEVNEASYSPFFDRIKIPSIDRFLTSEDYYATAFHEAVHSTGHPKRLGRFKADGGGASFGSESYSKEELIAEIGACATLNRLGINNDNVFKNNVAYISSWLKRMKDDKKLIIEAASRAEGAVKLMFGDVVEAIEAVQAAS